LRITSKYYLLGDDKKIAVFAKNGDFLEVIDAIGNGPNEVLNMSSFWADDQFIYIMDKGKQKILKFDFSSKLIHRIDLENSYKDFARFNESYLFDNQSNNISENVLTIADKDGNIIKEGIQLFGKGINYGKNGFQIQEDYALFLPSFHNTIYKIDKENNISPYYSFDFGHYWATKEECEQFINDKSGDAFALWKYLQKEDKIGFLSYTDSPDFLVLNFEKKDRVYNLFYNKINKKQYLVEYTNKNTLSKHPVISSEGNNLIIVIQASEYNQIKELPTLPISEEDNPILVSFQIE
jgi:hypothetical protein